MSDHFATDLQRGAWITLPFHQHVQHFGNSLSQEEVECLCESLCEEVLVDRSLILGGLVTSASHSVALATHTLLASAISRFTLSRILCLFSAGAAAARGGYVLRFQDTNYATVWDHLYSELEDFLPPSITTSVHNSEEVQLSAIPSQLACHRPRHQAMALVLIATGCGAAVAALAAGAENGGGGESAAAAALPAWAAASVSFIGFSVAAAAASATTRSTRASTGGVPAATDSPGRPDRGGEAVAAGQGAAGAWRTAARRAVAALDRAPLRPRVMVSRAHGPGGIGETGPEL